MANGYALYATSVNKEATFLENAAKGGNDKQRYSSFKIKEIGKKEEDSKALITVDTLVDWTDHDEGLHKGYDRMQKILSQLNQLKAKPEDEDINLSTTSASKKMSYGDSLSYSLTTTYTAPSNPKTRSHRSGNVIEDVLQSFVADTVPEQQLAYEDFEHIEKLDLEEMDLKWQMAMLYVKVHKFEQKARRKIDFNKKESARFNKKKGQMLQVSTKRLLFQRMQAKGGNDKQRYSSFKIKEIGKKEEDSK
nr:hypothetical protein [Tanacetum cinerariifolium]